MCGRRKSSVERNSYMLHWLVLGTAGIHDQHNQAMGRPRALDWAEAGLVEAVAHPCFCGDQISERETGRTVRPSASSRGGLCTHSVNHFCPALARGSSLRHVSLWRFGPPGCAGRGAPGSTRSSTETARNVRTTFVRPVARECALWEFSGGVLLVAGTWKCWRRTRSRPTTRIGAPAQS